MKRRALAALPLWALGARGTEAPRLDRSPLVFPRDHGAHPAVRTEWWYATGHLDADGGTRYGFQLTFFRSRTGLGEGNPSRFAARQLLFAHAAVTDLDAGRLLHAQRIARWSGDEAAPRAHARTDDTGVQLADWRFARADGRYRAALGDREAGFGYALELAPTQDPLLQGDEGWSRKGPGAEQASRYYSLPHLAVQGTLSLAGRSRGVRGTAWLDHEWSESLLDREAVGWDWFGMNLDDGGALTAFRLRRADGSMLWAGGSHRPRGGAVRDFAPGELGFAPGRIWTSPATQGRYPVEWELSTPVGRYRVRALLDAQELDSRRSTGSVYWEGLSELVDAATGRRAGLGYLEMTGVVSPLRLG